MKFEITYTVQGFLKVFIDVVEADNLNEAEVVLTKQVEQLVGKRQVQITLIKAI